MTEKAYENEMVESDVADKIGENEVEESESVHGGNNITDIRRRILEQNGGGKSNWKEGFILFIFLIFLLFRG